MTPLPTDEVDRQLAARGLRWQRHGAELRTTVTWQDFKEAFDFVGHVATLAEEANHHPDIAIHWNRVDLTLATHSEGGITGKDLDLASKIDALVS